MNSFIFVAMIFKKQQHFSVGLNGTYRILQGLSFNIHICQQVLSAPNNYL